jgi:hypothetical protein
MESLIGSHRPGKQGIRLADNAPMIVCDGGCVRVSHGQVAVDRGSPTRHWSKEDLASLVPAPHA